MVNDKIQLDSVSVVEAQKRIEEIFRDVFGSDDVKTIMFENHPLVKSKSYGETVEIYSEGGSTMVDTSDAGGTIISRIKSLGGTKSSSSTGEMYGGEAMRELDNGAETFEDGSVRFVPEFTKAQSKYRHPTDTGWDGGHSKCRSCAHFIEGGGCHVVQGDIDKEGYCEEFYADVGVYGHSHDSFVEENLIVWSNGFDWSMEDAKRFVEDVKERIEERIRS